VNTRRTVLVPDAHGLTALAGCPDLHPVRYGAADLPADAFDAFDAEIMVVTHTGVDQATALMHRLPRLRLVQTLTAGTDVWRGRIPPGVLLSNASGAGGGSTAEWVLAALLAVLREIPTSVGDQAVGRWNSRVTDTLDGKRVLILGAGDVGRNVRARLIPFGARVTMVARRPRPGVAPIDTVGDLLADHDVVVAALPLTPGSHHLVDARFLAALPDGCVLVNAARGEVVDTAALLAELHSGRLRAALDVTDPEPLPPDHPLWHAPGLLITPHLGGSTAGYEQRAWRVAAEQIARYLSGAALPNLVETPKRFV
jgi:phosphoglycerate dehydrogenase-like enzyme